MKRLSDDSELISYQEAYKLIVTMSVAGDHGDDYHNSHSAHGWLKYSSWIRSEMMPLSDGRLIYRAWDGFYTINLRIKETN